MLNALESRCKRQWMVLLIRIASALEFWYPALPPASYNQKALRACINLSGESVKREPPSKETPATRKRCVPVDIGKHFCSE